MGRALKAVARSFEPLFAEHLDDHPLASLAVELGVEHLLPRAVVGAFGSELLEPLPQVLVR